MKKNFNRTTCKMAILELLAEFGFCQNNNIVQFLNEYYSKGTVLSAITTLKKNSMIEGIPIERRKRAYRLSQKGISETGATQIKKPRELFKAKSDIIRIQWICKFAKPKDEVCGISIEKEGNKVIGHIKNIKSLRTRLLVIDEETETVKQFVESFPDIEKLKNSKTIIDIICLSKIRYSELSQRWSESQKQGVINLIYIGDD